MEGVSVIIPAYNAAAFIGDALNSARAQTYDNLEIIVVDDGSTDGTADVVSSFHGVRMIRQPNRGAAAARNRGIREASGRYLAFLDADDIWLPDKTRMQVEFLRSSGLKWCYCDSYFSWYGSSQRVGILSESQGHHDGDILVPYLFGEFSIPLPATVICREILEDIGDFDASMRTVEHTDLWARIAVKYPIGYVDRPLIEIRKRLDSLKQTVEPLETGRNRRRMLEKLLALTPERLEPRRNMLMAESYVNEGKHLLRYRRVPEAKACFRDAMRLRGITPRLFILWLACFFEPIPAIFLRLRWKLLHARRANLAPGFWNQD